MDNENAVLLKIKALAEGTPYECERESALKHLHRLMEKHGVTEQDLDGDAVTTHVFKCRNVRERTLLTQVLYKVFDSVSWTQYKYTKNGRKVSNTVGVDCTMIQKIEIDFLYDFYKKLYRKEEELFFSAFVQKHDLFGNGPSGVKSKEFSKEEEWRFAQMMESMVNNTPYKQIGEGMDE